LVISSYPILYDTDLTKIAYLDNALSIGYEKNYNGIWTAKFSLPADDSKNNLCQAMRFVKIFEGVDGSEVGLFRISSQDTIRTKGEIFITYYLEHVLITLMDSLLYRYHEIGGTGTYTTEVLQYIIDAQDTTNWRLGTVDYARQFQYSWENENLLAALFSVPKPFDADYRWTWSTTTHPWTLNLLTASTTTGPQIRAGRNLEGITYTEDSTNLCTKLYALGQGEGVNQLGIEESNPTGEAYIEADTIGTYGTITRVWVDRRYEHHETLYNAAVAMLEDLKEPRVEVAVNAIDLYKLTSANVDRFSLGRQVKIIDTDLGIEHDSRVIKLAKPNVNGDPGNLQIEIANHPQDIAGTIADLANRSRINEVYSQGATNIDSHQLADNMDASNPMRIKFHIPTEAVFINKVLLNYDISAFRAYSKGAASENLGTVSISTGTSSGASSSTTTQSSGSAHSHSVEATTAQSAGSGHSHGVTGGTASGSTHTHGTINVNVDGYTNYYTGSSYYHRHYAALSGKAIVSSAGWHQHDITGVTTTETGSAHSHTVSATTASSPGSAHTHTMPHTHSIGHSHTIGIHSHDITYGIYSGPTPTAVTVAVDGNTVPGLGLNETEVSILPYLDRDAGGKITRGFHEVTITPNALGRANVVIHIQQFLQSKGELRV
jgi:phage minor structural protein